MAMINEKLKLMNKAGRKKLKNHLKLSTINIKKP